MKNQLVDFRESFSELERIFKIAFPASRYRKIDSLMRKNIETLANANFRIYQVNMRALALRKKEYADISVYSRLELTARKSAEKRVQSKIVINRLLNSIYPEPRDVELVHENWMSDDVVFSVAESIDRILIESIKCADYKAHLANAAPLTARLWKEKISLSKRWGDTVKDFLKKKLKEVNRKGYYERIQETRTYDLKGIKKL